MTSGKPQIVFPYVAAPADAFFLFVFTLFFTGVLALIFVFAFVFVLARFGGAGSSNETA